MRLFKRRKPEPDPAIGEMQAEIRDLKLAIQRQDPEGDPVEESLKKGRRQQQPVIFYQIPGSKGAPARKYSSFGDTSVPEVGPVYDLSECIRLQDIESYYAVSVDRHVELIMKDGYLLDSGNPDAKAYVERRLMEMSYISGQPFGDTLRELVRNTVITANGYLVKKRDATRSSGRKIRLYNRELDPISALYVPDPSSITCKQNRSGRPYIWIQTVEEDEKRWGYTEVIHIPIRKKSGFLFGTPYVIPVLEDIRALRKLEQLEEHVAHKHAFPLMHWKVGSEDQPADMFAGPSGELIPEVQMAENYARMLAQEGFVCTSERNEIIILGAEGEALDLQPFIDHMELRVLGGLRLSELDIGRGDSSNKSTSQVLSRILLDACKEIQDAVSQYVNQYLIDELLLEGGFDPFKVEHRVRLAWPAIDKEEQRAYENHVLNQYVTGGITQDELRTALGRNPISPEEESGLFLNKWLIPLAEATAKAKAAAKPASSTSKASVSMKVRTQPTNQTGTLPTAPKISANDTVLRFWEQCATNVQQAVNNGKTVTPLFSQSMRLVIDSMKGSVLDAWTEGYRARAIALNINPTPPASTHVNKMLRYARSTDLQALTRTCMDIAGINLTTGMPETRLAKDKIIPTFEALKPILQTRVERFVKGARFLGELEAAQNAGLKEVRLKYADGAESMLSLNEEGLIHVASNPRLSEIG